VNKRAPRHVSIGILAWNESQRIGATIASLAEQSLLAPDQHDSFAVDVVCVANGCEDDTAAQAKAAFQRHLGETRSPVQYRVEEIETPGKSNAWNRFVHEFAHADSSFLILMDADIAFIEVDTLLNLVRTLESTPAAHVSIDRPVKDIAMKSRRGILEWLSLRTSLLTESVSPRICGQLYCGRAEVLRRLFLPVGLTTQDSFLTAMVRTDMLQDKQRNERIVRAPGASHVFEAYTTLSSIFRHQRAISIGSTINELLLTHLKENLNGEDGGTVVRRWTEADPDWFGKLVRRHFDARGWWVLPCRINVHRLRMLRGGGLRHKLGGLPVVLAGFLMDAAVTVSANHAIRRNNSSYFWEKSRPE